MISTKLKKEEKSLTDHIKHPYLRKLLITFPLFILLLIIDFILNQYVWNSEFQDSYLWGLVKKSYTVFNQERFFIITAIILCLYLLIPLLPFFKNPDRRSLNKFLKWSILVLALTTYIAGLFTPLYISEKLQIFGKEVSLWESIQMLFQYEEYYLGILVLLFTIVFPITKFIALIIEFIFMNFSNTLLFRLFKYIGKFSMLDVFVLAVLLLNMQLGSFFMTMELKEGIVFFSASVILSIILFNINGRKIRYESI